MNESESVKAMNMLKNMNLHDEVWVNEIRMSVVRVISGWLYSTYDPEKDLYITTTFVPHQTQGR